MIILTEAMPHEYPRSGSARDNLESTDAARLAGGRIYHLPTDFSQCENAENALWHVPFQDVPTLAIWIGFIPSLARYEAIHAELRRKRIYLPNNPEQHLVGLEFDRSYPRLAGITPKSISVTSPDQWNVAHRTLRYPLFVRGAARSRKAEGWKACVAETPNELQRLMDEFFALPYRSRGRVIVRELVRLRHSRYSDEGFPLGREYRVFLFDEKVLGFGYYWEGDDPLRELSTTEQTRMLHVAIEAARRVQVPFLIVDVGQTEDGAWMVIEVGDAQFAGTSQVPLIPLWVAISQAAGNWQPPE